MNGQRPPWVLLALGGVALFAFMATRQARAATAGPADAAAGNPPLLGAGDDTGGGLPDSGLASGNLPLSEQPGLGFLTLIGAGLERLRPGATPDAPAPTASAFPRLPPIDPPRPKYPDPLDRRDDGITPAPGFDAGSSSGAASVPPAPAGGGGYNGGGGGYGGGYAIP